MANQGSEKKDEKARAIRGLEKRQKTKKRRRRRSRKSGITLIMMPLVVITLVLIGMLHGNVPAFQEDDSNDGWTSVWDQTQDDAQCEDNNTGNAENTSEETSAGTSHESDLSSTAGDMDVHFIDVGQGDSTLIECDGEYMLVDAGQNDQGLVLWKYLQEEGATDLKYVIGTHPDADHIGGMDVIIYRCNVETVILPDHDKDTKTYDDVLQTMKSKSLERTTAVVGNVYTLGSATFTIVAPNADYGDADNDWSVGILLQNGNDRFLLVGDAEEAAEEDMLQNGIDLSADVYKVAHHGSNTGTIQSFLDAVNPTYAVISCGKGNQYGHPHKEVLDRLQAADIEVFRTDEQGTIIAHSSGSGITWNVSPSVTLAAGE